jgi:DNA-binding FrmR family transcriptional regulator
VFRIRRIDIHTADRVLDRPTARLSGRMGRMGMGVVGHAWLSSGRYTPHRYISLASYTYQGYVTSMQSKAKTSCLKRLNRIEGQVRGLVRMVDEDRYCIDVITQVSAVRAALKRVEEEVLRDHVAHCIEHAISAGDRDEQRRKIGELMHTLGKM